MEIKKTVQEILDSCQGAYALYLTDREGTPIIHVGDEVRQFPSVVSGQVNSNEQIDRLNIGEHKSSIFFYGQSQIVILSLGTVLAFIFSGVDANTGQLMALREKLLPVVEELEGIIPRIAALDTESADH